MAHKPRQKNLSSTRKVRRKQERKHKTCGGTTCSSLLCFFVLLSFWLVGWNILSSRATVLCAKMADKMCRREKWKKDHHKRGKRGSRSGNLHLFVTDSSENQWSSFSFCSLHTGPSCLRDFGTSRAETAVFFVFAPIYSFRRRIGWSWDQTNVFTSCLGAALRNRSIGFFFSHSWNNEMIKSSQQIRESIPACSRIIWICQRLILGNGSKDFEAAMAVRIPLVTPM